MTNAYANTYSFEGRSWTIDELGLEVQRLRRISERQSEMLAQALYEKNHPSPNHDLEKDVERAEKRANDLQSAYVSLRKRFEEAERCHAADYALLNRMKNLLKELVRS